MVGGESETNFKAKWAADKIKISGRTRSMCGASMCGASICAVSMAELGWSSEQEDRHEREKRGVRASRMRAVRARVSAGRAARWRRVCTRVMEGSRREADGGIRLERWIAGPMDALLAVGRAAGAYKKRNVPNNESSRISFDSGSGLQVRMLSIEPNDRGGVGRLESGT